MDFINGEFQLTNMHMHFSTACPLNSQVGLWLGKREDSYPTCGAMVNAGWVNGATVEEAHHKAQPVFATGSFAPVLLADDVILMDRVE